MRSVHDSQKNASNAASHLRGIFHGNGLYLKRIYAGRYYAGDRGSLPADPGLQEPEGHGGRLSNLPKNMSARNTFGAFSQTAPEEIRKSSTPDPGAKAPTSWKIWGERRRQTGPHDRNSDNHYTLEEVRMLADEAHMIQRHPIAVHTPKIRNPLKICIDGRD